MFTNVQPRGISRLDAASRHHHHPPPAWTKRPHTTTLLRPTATDFSITFGFAFALMGGLAIVFVRHLPQLQVSGACIQKRWDPLSLQLSRSGGDGHSTAGGRWALLLALGPVLAELQEEGRAGAGWYRAGAYLTGPPFVSATRHPLPTLHSWSIAMTLAYQELLVGCVRCFERRVCDPLCLATVAAAEEAECQVIAMAAILGGKLRTVRLGSSDLEVTDVCLGTMTWGVQNSEAEAHAQLDYAVKERGVNFLDTAEMYPVPTVAPEWVPGRTEDYIGSWLKKNPGWRERVVIATKIVGRMPGPNQVVANRTSPPSAPAPATLDAASVRQACEGSLRRLGVESIDLYQVHWPDRYVPLFGSSQYDVKQERPAVPIKETVQALWDLIKEGKIRYYGLSNETTFGVCEWVRAADELGAPRPVTIQNSFCLLNRTFQTELAEACAPSNYNISLLPWTPLGGGSLTGKYLDTEPPKGSRFQRFPAFMTRYVQPAALDATRRYKAIADESGISLATLALAWCRSRWYVSSTIIGATNLSQLQEDIDAFTVTLEERELAAIDAVHSLNKDPAVSL
eukprot:EG_transcript_5293